MSLEGRLRENLLMRGEWRDSLVYAIIEHEWTERKYATDLTSGPPRWMHKPILFVAHRQ